MTGVTQMVGRFVSSDDGGGFMFGRRAACIFLLSPTFSVIRQFFCLHLWVAMIGTGVLPERDALLLLKRPRDSQYVFAMELNSCVPVGIARSKSYALRRFPKVASED